MEGFTDPARDERPKCPGVPQIRYRIMGSRRRPSNRIGQTPDPRKFAVIAPCSLLYALVL